MKVLHLSTNDFLGGAAKAAYRLDTGLRKMGVDSWMFVQQKSSKNPFIFSNNSRFQEAISFIRSGFDFLPTRFYKNRKKSAFSISWLPSRISKKINKINPDMVHLNWICGGFLPLRSILKIKKPLVWTLHDSWAFTGGCHVPFNCKRYKEQCGKCPQLGSKKLNDLSHWNWKRKEKYLKDLEITFISPSTWLASCLKKSALFKDKKVVVIPNGIDLSLFKPVNKEFARRKLGLPLNKELILFGAMNFLKDKNKGFQYLQPALKKLFLEGWKDKAEAVIFGASKPREEADIGFKTHYLGKVKGDRELALIYSAADVTIVPSIQENLPNTIMESFSCGTPCVAFRVGGIPDMIDHKKNGYLAKPFKTEDLAIGIVWVLKNKKRLSNKSKIKALAEYDIYKVTKRYIKVYEDVLKEAEEKNKK